MTNAFTGIAEREMRTRHPNLLMIRRLLAKHFFPLGNIASLPTRNRKRKGQNMEHAQFVEQFNERHISVHINKNKAGFLYRDEGLMPDNLRAKQAWLRGMAFGGLLFGLIAFFYTPWWVAAGIVLVAFLSFPYVQASGVKGILQAALQSQKVYDVAVKNKVLRVKELPGPTEHN